nr:hypothetical protein [uncultured Desulfobacter sp.]
MADGAEPPADQHRVRHSKRIVDRTRDLSTVRDGDAKPVLDLGQEDDSNAGMSNDYVGNSYVSSVLADNSDPGVTLNTQDLQNGLSHSNDLESDPRIVKNAIQISEMQSYKAQKTESENEQIELDAGEETGLPRGNRAGPVADISLTDDQTKKNKHSKTPTQQSKKEADQSSPPDMSADEMLFDQGVLTEKNAPEKENGNTRSMQPAWDHPDIPAGVRGALEEYQADFTGQPGTQAKKAMNTQKEQTQTVSIGRVSVRVKLPDPEPPAQVTPPVFGAETMASRYFMGDA